MNKSKDKRQPIKVFVRVRPINESERSRGSPFVVECSNNREVVVNERPSDRITKKFTFDQVFGPVSKQIDIYKFVASPLIKEVLDGYNCTIFAYGQTGTGKTYTMEGTRSGNTSVGWMSDPHCGIIPRAVSHLFDELRLLGVEYSVKASFLELYNEELFDLLSPVDDSSKIRLYEDATKKGAIIVNGLDEVPVRDKQEVYTLLERGSKKRQTAATLMNAVSSRSHTVFSITVRIREAGVEDEVLRTGKLNLVDLAGSENIGRSGAVEKRAREAGNINQSLLTLGRVITALVEKTPHIPYRESKLTRLLQESLGGCTKTCIIATVSPTLCNVEETLSTLDYAHRAKNIQNKPEINQKIGKAAFIKEYIEEIYRLKADLMATREKCGFYLAEDNYKDMVNQIERQSTEINELLSNNKSLVELSEKKEELNRQLSESLEKYMNDLERTKAVLNATKRDRDKQVFLLQHRVETERSLTSQAQSLLNVADAATNDVALLHDTLHRKRNLEENNMAASQNFSSILRDKLGHMTQVSRQFEESRLVGFEQLLLQLDSGSNACLAYLKHSSSEVSNVSHNHDEFINKMFSLNEELGTQANFQIDNVIKESAAANAFNTKEDMNLLNEILGKEKQMSNEFADVKRMLTSFFQDLKTKLEERHREEQQFLSCFNKHLEDFKKGIEEQERLSCYVGDVTRNIQKWKEKTNEVIKTLQSQVNDIDMETKPLNTFLDKSDFSILKSNIQELDGRVQDSVVECAVKFDDMINSTNEGSKKANEKLNCLDNISSRICEDIEQHRMIVPERNQTSLTKTHAQLECVTKDLIQYQASVQSTAEELQRFHNQFVVDHKNSIDNHVQHDLQVANTCKDEIHNEINSQKSYTATVTCKIEELERLCNDFVLQEMKSDTPSGDTPQRRQFTYPRILVCTSPHERILSRFNAVDEEDSSLERSETPVQPSMEPAAGSSLEQTAISRSKSASSISVGNATTRLSCVSEPNIPSTMSDKENSSRSQSIPRTKSPAVKRPVLTDHNKK